MAQYLKKDRIAEIFSEFGGEAKNTGSTEGQIALFTNRIHGLRDHLQKNNKDHSSRKTLLGLVGKRRRLLKYLAKKDIIKYRALLEKLGIRK